jgi:pilus assembly protein CpaF
VSRHEEIEERLYREVTDQLVARLQDDGADSRMTRDDQRALGHSLLNKALASHAQRCLENGEGVLAPDEEDALARRVMDRLFASGSLQPYLEDPTVMEVNANGAAITWIVRTDGTKEPGPPLASSNAALVELVRSLAAEAGREGGIERRFDAAHPRLDLQLPNGDRLFAVMGVSQVPIVSIRRHNFIELVTLDQLHGSGMLDLCLRDLLGAMVAARCNVIVSGGTGVGKTTLLRAMCNAIGPEERLVVIEDSPELGLDRFGDKHPDLVSVAQREENIEGEGAVSIADLTRWMLRANPDRVIVGEVRGPEVIPMLNAMTQGNQGSMCSVHANSSKSAFGKLATYAVQAPERLPLEATNQLIASAVDFVIHLERVGGRNSKQPRAVASVREVVGHEGPLVVSNEVLSPGPHGRAVPATPLQPETLAALESAGFDASLLDRPEGWWT